MAYSDIKDKEDEKDFKGHKNLAEFMGVKEEDLPTIRALTYTDQLQPEKFTFQEKPGLSPKESIESFIEDINVSIEDINVSFIEDIKRNQKEEL